MIIMLPQKDMAESVMERVRILFVLRRLMYPLIVEAAVIAGGILYLTAFVSIGDVIANTRNVVSLEAFAGYIVSAISHTELVMQLLLLAIACFSIFFAWKAFKTFKIAAVSRSSFAQA